MRTDTMASNRTRVGLPALYTAEVMFVQRIGY